MKLLDNPLFAEAPAHGPCRLAPTTRFDARAP